MPALLSEMFAAVTFIAKGNPGLSTRIVLFLPFIFYHRRYRFLQLINCTFLTLWLSIDNRIGLAFLPSFSLTVTTKKSGSVYKGLIMQRRSRHMFLF
jgi:hypothetical protein